MGSLLILLITSLTLRPPGFPKSWYPLESTTMVSGNKTLFLMRILDMC